MGFQWNLFLVIFWTKFQFDKSKTRSTYGKKTETPNLHISTIFAFLRNWEGSLYHENIIFQIKTQFWAQNSFCETTIEREFSVFNVVSIPNFNDYKFKIEFHVVSLKLQHIFLKPSLVSKNHFVVFVGFNKVSLKLFWFQNGFLGQIWLNVRFQFYHIYPMGTKHQTWNLAM